MKRLYNAACAWLEADAAAKSAPAPEPQPEGNNFAQAEYAHSFSGPPEMHAGYDRRSIDDDDSGVYRVGFQPNKTT